jgi:hypothetical protein
MPISDIMGEYSKQISTMLIYFCVLYTAASLCSGLILHFWLKRKWGTSPAKRTMSWISPIIKPENYQDENTLLRKSINAVNWNLIANKARALHVIRHKTKNSKLRSVLNSASFTFGQREFHVRPLLDRTATI